MPCNAMKLPEELYTDVVHAVLSNMMGNVDNEIVQDVVDELSKRWYLEDIYLKYLTAEANRQSERINVYYEQWKAEQEADEQA